jgi:hypothetical protein
MRLLLSARLALTELLRFSVGGDELPDSSSNAGVDLGGKMICDDIIRK